MSYTTSCGQPQGTPMCFTNRIREALIGEIIAINGYAEHIANSHMEEINAAWKSIMKDEKEHYGMLLKLLHKYDLDQYAGYQEHKADHNGPATPLQAYKPDYDNQIILNNIRLDIKGELEAVIRYEQEFADIPFEDSREVFYRIIVDEKGHLEHLTRILLKYDTAKNYS